jgi:hypothetical protein
MDRQYEHVFVGNSNHYGFLSYYPDECIDQVAEERINNQRKQKAEGRKQKSDIFSLCTMRFALCDLGV